MLNPAYLLLIMLLLQRGIIQELGKWGNCKVRDSL